MKLKMWAVSSVLIAMILSAAPARASLIIQSYWQLGEDTNRGLDSSSANDGEVNNFNNTAGTTVLMDTPSGVNGSTAYVHTSGNNYQGIWMFGAGSNNQTVPADNWGVQFMVRSTSTASIAGTGTFRAIYGMKDTASGGLVIEVRRHSDGNAYWDVNNAGVANLITPRDTTTLVNDNEWTALALVKNAGTLYFYVDKILAGTSTGTWGTDGLLALGFQQGVGTHQFIGDFDEASFFTFDTGQFNATTDLIPEPATTGLIGMVGVMALLRKRMKR